MMLTEDAMKLTKSVVEDLPAPALGYTLHWEGSSRASGFGSQRAVSRPSCCNGG